MATKQITNASAKVSVTEFARALDLEVVYSGRGEIDLETISVTRPGLPLAGYFKFFDHKRVQVVGNAEYEFLQSLKKETATENLDKLFSKQIPCLIFSRKLPVFDFVIKLAEKYGCPILSSYKVTTVLINDITIYQNELLAPTKVVHGVLLDVFGVGMLIVGKSGIGKSEVALELVHRGHRLVSDDSVIVKNINEQLIGKAPEKIKYYMEIRGIGIINLQQMFGPGAIRPEKSIDIIVELSPWAEGNTYDRIGNEESYEELLGIEKPKIAIPVTPGRNVPIIIETAARKYRLKQAGYDAAAELVASVFGEDKQ